MKYYFDEGLPIDERINMRAQKKKQEWVAQPVLTSSSFDDIFRDFIEGRPVPHDEVQSKPKESAMRTEAQLKMQDRVHSVVWSVTDNMKKEFHIHADPTPSTVQGIMDALANGSFKPRKDVKPTDKISQYESIKDYFEFRTVDADHEGFQQKSKELEFDKIRVNDSIIANPNPEKAFEDFQSFLTKWEPNPTQKSN